MVDSPVRVLCHCLFLFPQNLYKLMKYLTIDNKRYLLHRRDYTERSERFRKVSRGLTGKTIVQDFGHQNYIINATILVYVTPPRPEYGSLADLQAAYALVPVTVTDVDGITRQMVFISSLDVPRAYSLVDDGVPFKVKITLEEFINGY